MKIERHETGPRMSKGDHLSSKQSRKKFVLGGTNTQSLFFANSNILLTTPKPDPIEALNRIKMCSAPIGSV